MHCECHAASVAFTISDMKCQWHEVSVAWSVHLVITNPEDTITSDISSNDMVFPLSAKTMCIKFGYLKVLDIFFHTHTHKNVWKRKESCYHGAFSLHAKWRNSVFDHAIHVCYVLPKDFTINSFFFISFFEQFKRRSTIFVNEGTVLRHRKKQTMRPMCAVIQCTNSVFCSQHHLRLILPGFPFTRFQRTKFPSTFFFFFLKTPGPTEAQMHWSNFVRTFKVSWH